MLDNLLRGALTTSKQSVVERYNDLAIDLTKCFVEMKAEPVMGVIEKQMNDYGVDWKHATEPRGECVVLRNCLYGCCFVGAALLSLHR